MLQVSGCLYSLRSRFKRAVSILLFGLLIGPAGFALADEGPRWLQDGRPNADATQAIALLQAAGADGLDPANYQAGPLANTAAQAGPLSPAEQSAFAASLTAAMQRFISDLHFGRVQPRDIHIAFKLPPQQFDPNAYLKTAVANHTLAASVRAAAPQLPLYATLREALAHHRELAKHPTVQDALAAPAGGKLEPGKPYAGLAQLAQRLIALGDLAADTQVGTVYSGALVDGVKAFQLRHGLGADGVLGKATLKQLNLPLAARIRQIELTLERLRWTPLLLSERMIVVNVPEFVLRAYELKDGGMRLSMNVIVGKALNTRTPLFVEEMRAIEFSPYWNIPPSIAKAETVPKLRREPGYFEAQGLEFVGADGHASATLSEANLDAVMQGKMRIRQRPGEKNALGDIKFIFPNNDNIYLHHTPSVELFGRQRRDFSHGCIRIEDPVALARFVLQSQPEWTEERIRAAMDSGKPTTLRLAHPLPVVIAYATVIVKNKQVHFFEDIYGNDKLLDAAMKAKKQ
ncbi:MAG: L,D-transpeptidase family protein [Burkholderiaceae bacterium]|nr:L,D-transpeptidase family protein [Burkholderiaceae bacterium]